MILRRCLQRQSRLALSGEKPSHLYSTRRHQSTTTTYDEPLDELSHLVKSGLTSSITAKKVKQPEGGKPQKEPKENLADQWREFNFKKNKFKQFGSLPPAHYQPNQLILNPPKPSDVTLELLLASEAHLGHSTSLWNPANSRYIFGIRQGIHIMSLDVIAAHLRRAAKVVEEVTRKGGLVLFVGTRDGHQRCVVRAAGLAGGYHLFERWVPGGITNGQQILGACSLKVVDQNDQEIHGFEEQLQGRASMKPDLVVCLNTMENYVLMHECRMESIPTIGIIDTNANPTWVTYPIPANDDSLRCVQLIAGVLGRAGQSGRERRLAAAKNKQYTFRAADDLKIPMTEERRQEKEAVAKARAEAKAEAEAKASAQAQEEESKNTPVGPVPAS